MTLKSHGMPWLQKLNVLVQKIVNLQMKLQEQETLVSTFTETQLSLTDSIHKLENRLKELKEELSVSQENNHLLVEFPDLNGPVNVDFRG